MFYFVLPVFHITHFEKMFYLHPKNPLVLSLSPMSHRQLSRRNKVFGASLSVKPLFLTIKRITGPYFSSLWVREWMASAGAHLVPLAVHGDTDWYPWSATEVSHSALANLSCLLNEFSTGLRMVIEVAICSQNKLCKKAEIGLLMNVVGAGNLWWL